MMTKNEMMELASEAGLWVTSVERLKAVEKFTELVEAAEREACAALCFQMWNEWMDEKDTTPFPDAEDCAAAIRARGQS
jgi:hypothetical protein